MKKLFKMSVLAIALTAIGQANAESLRDSAISVSPETNAFQSWMSPEVNEAWAKGYKGTNGRIIVVDDFSSANKFYGNLGEGVKLLRHGEWTLREAQLVAPSSAFVKVGYNSTSKISLSTSYLNVVNASYGLLAPTGYSLSQINLGTLHTSIVGAAKAGTAIVSKSAGNNGGVAVDGSANGNTDYMNLALKGAPTAIFVGALDSNGTVDKKATIASYSNIAGNDPVAQKQYLMVGVEGTKTGLYGTSFAAPVVSAYSGIIRSKFRTANATQITNQLLNTARTDTINNYNVAVHGRGEASLTRALAPVSIK